ncbi:MAG: CapA family protein, partial [Acidimicrobiia bacterium]|nr:CapA family protein [Acidimicrobiia bacterium]
ATSTEPPPELRRFTMAFTGDFLLHNRVNATAAAHGASRSGRDYDYRPLLGRITPWLRGADWAICHLEVNLSADNARLAPYPVFRAPGQIAFDARAVGYDSCSVASNHILDHGADGVAETLGVLDAAGLASTGAARSADEAAEQVWLDVGGVRVAHLSYTYGLNGLVVPGETPWLTNVIDEHRILEDATSARDAGAEFVVLSLHWGEQYTHELNRQQRDLGPRLLGSPAIDLIVGHHAHVVQPIDLVDGEWLVYGMGNLLADYAHAVRRDELLVVATVTERSTGAFATALRAVPLHVDHDTLAVYPSNPADRDPVVSRSLSAELDASWARVRSVLERGTGWDRLTIG